ncbi:hypothetical protein AVEN_32025-1 [Araneus ventricosus]|uniref:Uncharacterized protein n=1 Tax=Araneus ventricosus TaxID=182803 RepID=A0A4Y1ZMN1_ARAVE|nr:hypothetical protein AVEN_32025-1 [Araneus ventricosus]
MCRLSSYKNCVKPADNPAISCHCNGPNTGNFSGCHQNPLNKKREKEAKMNSSKFYPSPKTLVLTLLQLIKSEQKTSLLYIFLPQNQAQTPSNSNPSCQPSRKEPHPRRLHFTFFYSHTIWPQT